MALNIKSLADLLNLGKKQPKVKSGGMARTATFDPNADGGIITVPAYREHLTDLFDTRQANDSRSLMSDLFKHDPDVAAAVNGYLTLANTELVMYVKDPATGDIDAEASKTLEALVMALFEPFDYSKGFQLKPDLATACEELRYATLLRGGISAELVFDKTGVPDRLQNVDLATVEWKEKEPGVYKPFQKDKATNKEINLDFPTFLVAFHRRDPNKIYPFSDFVAAVNSIAARQLVINELYAIMRQTGYPRLSIKVLEEVIVKNAPAQIKTDPVKLRDWLRQRLREIGTSVANLKSGQPFVHWDSVEASSLNEKSSGAALDIRPVIEVLNAQNQAALKTMPTVLGRGGNVQTASVEARYAAMCADELNKPVAVILRRAFQFLLNVQGIPGIVELYFLPAELRPDLELEPQRVMMASRLKDDLSLGLITDAEYHLWMHNRLPPDGAPQLAGTGFVSKGPQADVSAVSPNSDPLGRSVASADAKSARSNANTNSGGGRAVE